MNKYLIIIFLMTYSFLSQSHSGRTNRDGCHNNSKTGDYHCHSRKTSLKTYQPIEGSCYKDKKTGEIRFKIVQALKSGRVLVRFRHPKMKASWRTDRTHTVDRKNIKKLYSVVKCPKWKASN